MCPAPVEVTNEQLSRLRPRGTAILQRAPVAAAAAAAAAAAPVRYTRPRRPLTPQLMIALWETRRFPSEFHRDIAARRIERIATTWNLNNRQDMMCFAFDREIARWQNEEGLVNVHEGQETREHLQYVVYKYERMQQRLAEAYRRETWLLYIITGLAAGLIALAASVIHFAASK